MSRRSSKNTRRFGESGGIGALFGFNSLSRSSPYFPIALILLVLVHFGFRDFFLKIWSLYMYSVLLDWNGLDTDWGSVESDLLFLFLMENFSGSSLSFCLFIQQFRLVLTQLNPWVISYWSRQYLLRRVFISGSLKILAARYHFIL